MGVCSSCLGDRNAELVDEDDPSRHLFEDGTANYGSFPDGGAEAMNDADPQEVQRENEALQKVVVQTSNHLVDIFAVASQDTHPPSGAIFSGQDARLLRYKEALERVSTGDTLKQRHDGKKAKSRRPARDLVTDGAGDAGGWDSEDDDDQDGGVDHFDDDANDEATSKDGASVPQVDVGSLVAGFADARRS